MTVRAFTPADCPDLRAGARLELDPEESRYLSKVRRLRVGQRFDLLDGRAVWTATLRTSGPRTVEVEVETRQPTVDAPERIVVLGLPDAPATLEALTVASEAGATEVIVVRCERSQARVPAPARVQRILRAAQRQCGRATAPTVHGLGLASLDDGPWTLDRALARRDELPGWFARARWIDDRPGTCAQVEGGQRVAVGPEGGFTDAEVTALRGAGWSPLRLGPWTLRTPTAVVAALAKLHP